MFCKRFMVKQPLRQLPGGSAARCINCLYISIHPPGRWPFPYTSCSWVTLPILFRRRPPACRLALSSLRFSLRFHPPCPATDKGGSISNLCTAGDLSPHLSKKIIGPRAWSKLSFLHCWLSYRRYSKEHWLDVINVKFLLNFMRHDKNNIWIDLV